MNRSRFILAVFAVAVWLFAGSFGAGAQTKVKYRPSRISGTQIQILLGGNQSWLNVLANAHSSTQELEKFLNGGAAGPPLPGIVQAKMEPVPGQKAKSTKWRLLITVDTARVEADHDYATFMDSVWEPALEKFLGVDLVLANSGKSWATQAMPNAPT